MSAIQIMTDKECEIYESCNIESLGNSIYDAYYQEAVFIHGKEKLKQVEKCVADIKKELFDQLGIVEDGTGKREQKFKANYDWKKFYKSLSFKKLEDELKRVFGFRSVEIVPIKDEYYNNKKVFYYNFINAYTVMNDRYPIDGLVTDNGFYDSTHSISLFITLTNVAIMELTPGEFIACLLHEIGHNIDPALVDIKYTQVNILSKYLTDRKNKIVNAERKLMENIKRKKGITGEGLIVGIYLIFYIFILLWSIVISLGGFGRLWRHIKNGFKNLFHIQISDAEIQERIDRIKKKMEEDKKQFTRQEFSEAFADNFARMYGYGAELAKLLKKIDMQSHKQIRSWYSKERSRQEAIMELVIYTLEDEHKHELTRIQALIREYKEEINDKHTPKDIKKKLQEDLDELEAVYNSYTDNFDEFYKRCIEMMKESLLKKDEIADTKKENNKKANKLHNESVDIFNEESLVNDKKKMKEIVIKQRMNNNKNKSFSIYSNKKLEVDSEIEKKCRRAMQKLFDDTKVDSIRLFPGENFSEDKPERRFDTKLGGIPYWPKNMKWPYDKGYPLVCVAQLNFDKLPKLKNYPTNGILQFFIDQEYSEEICKIVYHEDIHKNNLLENVPLSTLMTKQKNLQLKSYSDFEYFSIQGVYYPEAKIVKSGINIYDCIHSIDGNYTLIWDYYENYLKEEFGDNIPVSADEFASDIYVHELNKDGLFGTRIGGWPSFMQADSRDKDHDILLLQLDSEKGMQWGDMGIANFFTSLNNLKNKKFDDVLFTWDCM